VLFKFPSYFYECVGLQSTNTMKSVLSFGEMGTSLVDTACSYNEYVF